MNILRLALTTAITGPVAQPVAPLPRTPRSLTIQANFIYGSGGTSVDAWVQTSLDSGASWTDIAQFHFTTALARRAVTLSSLTPVLTQVVLTDGSLTANTALDGILGPQYRAKVQSAGTYVGTILAIDVQGEVIPAWP